MFIAIFIDAMSKLRIEVHLQGPSAELRAAGFLLLYWDELLRPIVKFSLALLLKVKRVPGLKDPGCLMLLGFSLLHNRLPLLNHRLYLSIELTHFRSGLVGIWTIGWLPLHRLGLLITHGFVEVPINRVDGCILILLGFYDKWFWHSPVPVVENVSSLGRWFEHICS